MATPQGIDSWREYHWVDLWLRLQTIASPKTRKSRFWVSPNTIREVVIDNTAVEYIAIPILLPDGRQDYTTASVIVSRAQSLEIPPIISIIVGEIIYNLRAALDYLVYELAKFDAGQAIGGTQFPIEHTKNGFKGRIPTFLKGLSVKHVAAIKVLQPFKGCNWTGILSTISNPDKHQHLAHVVSQVTAPAPPGGAEAIISGQTVGMKKDISAYIGFGDETPVIDTLEQLQLKVAETLDAFKPEFKRFTY